MNYSINISDTVRHMSKFPSSSDFCQSSEIGENLLFVSYEEKEKNRIVMFKHYTTTSRELTICTLRHVTGNSPQICTQSRPHFSLFTL